MIVVYKLIEWVFRIKQVLLCKKMSTRRINVSQLQLYFFCISGLAVLVFLCLTDTIFSQYNNKCVRLQQAEQQPTMQKYFKKKKYILLWNSAHRIETAVFGTGHQAFISAKCPVSDCELVTNSDLLFLNETRHYGILEMFDAVLIHVHELWLSSLFSASYRRPGHQRIVFLTQESPLSSEHLDISQFKNVFNWTMTYRLDSDIQLLYGRFEKRTLLHSVYKTTPRTNNSKTGQVVWMATHCWTYSRREEYVYQLSQLIPVDVYGQCGNLSCTWNDKDWLSEPECYEHLASRYKFYLSFENTICTDYVTEKFFNILQTDMIPVVMGAADYKSIAPPHSYIDALQFKGPEDLAKYLIKLDGDDRLYEEYFRWKETFIVESGVNQMARHAFCDLCAKLNRPDEPEKYYESLEYFWGRQTQCFGSWDEFTPKLNNKTDLPLFN